MTVAIKIKQSLQTPIGVSHYRQVKLSHQVMQAVYRYARKHRISVDVALAEAVAAYFVGDVP